MTDLCNEQYSIFVQIIGGARPPRAPPPPIPTALYIQRVNNKKNTTVVPTKSDSDVIFCLHLLSKH